VLFQFLARTRLNISEIMEELEFHGTQLQRRSEVFSKLSRMSSLKLLFDNERRAMSQRTFRKTWTTELINDMQMAEEVTKKRPTRTSHQDLHELVSSLMQNSIKGKNVMLSRNPVSEAQVKLVRNFQLFKPIEKEKKKPKSLKETSLPIIRGNMQVAKAFRTGLKLCTDPRLVADLKKLINGHRLT
jgi:hypothetical protein